MTHGLPAMSACPSDPGSRRCRDVGTPDQIADAIRRDGRSPSTGTSPRPTSTLTRFAGPATSPKRSSTPSPPTWPRFGTLVRDATVTVAAMSAAELEAAVVGPAERVGARVEPALVAELVAAVVDEPAALPSLQYTLYELAERSPDRCLTLAAYRERVASTRPSRRGPSSSTARSTMPNATPFGGCSRASWWSAQTRSRPGARPPFRAGDADRRAVHGRRGRGVGASPAPHARSPSRHPRADRRGRAVPQYGGPK
jgi:Novel STAND NTPase 1